MGDIALQCIISSDFDVYGDPIIVTAYGANGFNMPINVQGNKDGVLIYNSVARDNTNYICKYYANQLWDIDRIISVNLAQQKTPCIVQCDDNQRLTLENLFKQVDGNVPLIFGSKNLDLSSAKVLDLKATYKGEQLYELKRKVFNDALTALGVSNVTEQKKERTITDEVMRGMGGVFANRQTRLKPRELACDMINARFGTNISVEFVDIGGYNGIDGGETYGKLHTNN